ncbi:hypothetical protein [Thalassobacillus hwangdonensis]|uniref:Uncharacterized protein n=1 Tax=Thalassobacillus hwangdonensis TaxID=546108 RepID=A0ABW3L853_9BACI
MRNKQFFLITVWIILLTSFVPSKASATTWEYSFVVWDGYIYVISDEEYVTDVDKEIGHVTKYSDMDQYAGNFSNTYKKGTKYYSIEGVSTDEAIAIEESDGQYIKAYREEKYGYGSIFDVQRIVMVLIFLVMGIFAIFVGYKLLENKRDDK